MESGIDTYFDYQLQVWVVDGIVQTCGHPESMRTSHACCNANLYRNMKVEVARDMYMKSAMNIDRITGRR